MASSSSNKATRSPANMEVDYVISYRFSNVDKTKAIAEYEKLVEALASVGLSTEVRNGTKHSILVFVKLASEKHLWGEVYRSRIKDWLHGVRASSPEKDVDTAGTKGTLYPAERLRIIYQLITNPTDEGGAGITPTHGQWTNVESIFALHDHDFNKQWLKKWATSSMLKVEDLDQIRDRFGEKIAFYFAFTQAYFTALIGMALFGASAWIVLGHFSGIFAIMNSLMCVGFIEYWKHQEHDLAIRWGVKGVSTIETKRHGFKSDKAINDPITGEQIQLFSGTKRLQRQMLQLPFAFTAISVLGALIATCFGIEIFVSEIYNGPMKSMLVYLPTVIITTVQPLLLGFLTSIAQRLTDFENYETDAAAENAMTQKIFVLNFITSYMPLLMTAFVYVPFASHIVPYLDVFSLTVRPFAESKDQMKSPQSGFKINPSRLKGQVIYLTVTAQIVNQALEIVVPYFKRQGLNKYKEMQSQRAAKHGGVAPGPSETDLPEEAAFLKRVREEAELDVYDVTTDFREMVVQYGYLAMFSVVWPPTAVSFLINNWLELRTDAAKICIESQHPTPWRADSIGSWLDSLGFLTWFGSISTSAIVYMFSDKTGMGPGGSPSDVKLWGLLLAVFFSEHSYLLARWAVRIFVSKLDSPARQRERGDKYLVRKRYLDENIGEQAARMAPHMSKEEITRDSLEEEARESSVKTSTIQSRFWGRQRGWEETAKVGSNYIFKAAPEESKKAQ